MNSLYLLPPNARIFIILLIIVSIATQTALLLLLSYHKQYKVNSLYRLNEHFVMVHMIFSSMLLGAIHLQYQNLTIAFGIMFFFDALLSVLSFYIAVKHRRFELLLFILLFPSMFMSFNSHLFYLFFITCSLFLFFRSFFMLDIELYRSKNSITKLSIKEVVNKLRDGVLYADNKGNVFITSPIMHKLIQMMNLSNNMKVSSLWNELCKERSNLEITSKQVDDGVLVRFPNKGSWLFTRSDVFLNRKIYTQIMAIDITEEDALTKEFELSNKKLTSIKHDLSEHLKNIEYIEKEKEILNSKARVHDILGQRLSILNRVIENEGCTIDTEKLKHLLSNLIDTVTDENEYDIQNTLNTISDSYALIGVKIHFEGIFPMEKNVAMNFAENIRECSTNAVRHAFAENVYVVFSEDSNYYRMSISNDGIIPNCRISKGSGINSMKRRAEKMGGRLEIINKPPLYVNTIIPKRSLPND